MHTDDDGIARIEHAVGQHAETAREDGNMLELVSLRSLVILCCGERWQAWHRRGADLDVARKLVKQMVDNVGRENLDSRFIGDELMSA
jgi:hypothetical protein